MSPNEVPPSSGRVVGTLELRATSVDDALVLQRIYDFILRHGTDEVAAILTHEL
jgi:hypothetical protein